MRMTTVSASGRPGTWRAMLSDLGTELQRARLHGFTDARGAGRPHDADRRRRGERAARDHAPGAGGAARAQRDDVTRQTPSMSAAQNLALLQRLLPGITAREVSDAFAANFDPSRVPGSSPSCPRATACRARPELLALGRTAVDVKPDKLAEVRAGHDAAGRRCPRGGTVVESVTHAASGVTSMWLDNGVRVHHRQMDQRQQRGEHRDHAGRRHDRGDGGATAGSPRRRVERLGAPGHEHGCPSTQIRDLMTGAKVRVSQRRGGDTADAHRLRRSPPSSSVVSSSPISC